MILIVCFLTLIEFLIIIASDNSISLPLVSGPLEASRKWEMESYEAASFQVSF